MSGKRDLVAEMAPTLTSSIKAQRNTRGFTAVLSCAACEWCLLFLLLVNGVLSYLLTKFASYCNLQAPCILCSRLDHILGKAKPGYYRNLLCSNHQSEISSLVLCHIHGKLAEGHGMCDDCLFSFTLKNTTNTEAQKLLMSKLGVVFVGGLCSPLINKDFTAGAAVSRLCTCCRKLVKSRQDAQRLLTLKSSSTHVPKPNLPLPRVPRRSRLSRKNSLNRNGDKFSESKTYQFSDPSSHTGFSEIKFGSDSESEFPFSEDEEFGNLIIGESEPKSGHGNPFISTVPPRRTSSEPLRSIRGVTNPLPSPFETSPKSNISKVQDLKSVPPNAASICGLNEIDWHQSNKESPSSAVPDPIYLGAILTPSSGGGSSHYESSGSKIKSPLPESSFPAAPSELIHLDDKSDAGVASTEKYTTQPRPAEHESIINRHDEDSKKNDATGSTLLESDHRVNHSSEMIADTNKKRKPFSSAADQPMMGEPTRVSEESKGLSPHSSSLIGDNASVEVPAKDGHGGEMHTVNASDSTEPQVLQKSISVESGLESLDGSNISEVEGENLIDRLKNQVLYYKKCTNALHKELDEERNHSAVAANEAMAMITRLQEEKAALHMDALQYLRMMEEQAEYDGEELDKSNDLLAEKEKEIQDLEAELELYRSNFCNEPMGDSMHQKSCDSQRESIPLDSNNAPCTVNRTNISLDSKMRNAPKGSHDIVWETSCLKLEDEKLYISQRLESLEKKLNKIFNKEPPSEVPRSETSEKHADGTENRKYEYCNGAVTKEDRQVGENYALMKHDSYSYNGRNAEQDDPAASDNDGCSVIKENGLCVLAKKSSDPKGEVNLAVLANEILDLNDRLEALEAEHDFLVHTLNCLQNEKEGLQFIREIAQQLQELQKLGMKS